uniref:Uncharacterized protein n=1 Tax=Knipowitschia caucasica TaxID=637954 RepID=A0AAV2M720_KNICA
MKAIAYLPQLELPESRGWTGSGSPSTAMRDSSETNSNLDQVWTKPKARRQRGARSEAALQQRSLLQQLPSKLRLI